MTVYLGIDAAQRHTGYCYRNSTMDLKGFFETKTGKADIFSSCLTIREHLRKILKNTIPSDAVFCVERQLSSPAANFSPLQFHVYLVVLEEIWYHTQPHEPKLVLPTPMQLKSYMARKHGIDTSSKKTIVEGYKNLFPESGRKSSHKVEAYFLTLLGEDVVNSEWFYNYGENTSRVAPTLPWKPVQGKKGANGTGKRKKTKRQTG